MHAVRDPPRDGGGVRRLSGAGLLLTGGREWWSSYFDSHYVRELEPTFSLERDRREVARLIEALALPVGARLLDLGCGQGRHAHLLAEAGFDVQGLDQSEHLLSLARRRGTGRTLRYTQGDMRRLPARWTGRFDAVVNLFTSFGFFLHPADDARVIREVARVLAPEGVFVWQGADRDGTAAHLVERDWWPIADQTHVMHEREFDPISGVLTVRSTWTRTRARHHEYRIRMYTPTRLAELCADAGLVVEAAYDGWTDRPVRRSSSEMLLVARKDPA